MVFYLGMTKRKSGMRFERQVFVGEAIELPPQQKNAIEKYN
jgi:hypothetical protein